MKIDKVWHPVLRDCRMKPFFSSLSVIPSPIGTSNNIPDSIPSDLPSNRLNRPFSASSQSRASTRDARPTAGQPPASHPPSPTINPRAFPRTGAVASVRSPRVLRSRTRR